MRDLCVKKRAVVGEHDKESAHADELMECGVDCKQLPAVRKRSSPKRVLEARAVYPSNLNLKPSEHRLTNSQNQISKVINFLITRHE